MFDLEQAITGWRQQMLAAGINDGRTLDELESHLRDEMQPPLRNGFSEPAAFDLAVQQIGPGHVLQSEFAKTGGTLFQKVKHFLCRLAGIRSCSITLLLLPFP